MTQHDAPPSLEVLLVCFDTPFPVNYGGVYDVVARARYLQETGYQIDLLCCYRDPNRLREMRRQERESANPLFRSIFAIPEKLNLISLLRGAPLSVAIRDVLIPSAVARALRRASYRFVLVEHLKLFSLAMRLSPIVSSDFRLRMHNDEHDYYRSLGQKSRAGLRKIFLLSESILYRRYQKSALSSQLFSTVYFISTTEMQRLSAEVCGTFRHLPVYFRKSKSPKARSQICSDSLARTIDFLYVGNLNLDDNVQAVVNAMRFLDSRLARPTQVVICGRCDSTDRQGRVFRTIAVTIPCEIKFNVTRESLDTYYSTSKCFLNFSTNSGGVKTKLIEALEHGLLVISDSNGLNGSGLDSCCLAADATGASQLERLITSPDFYEQQRQLLLRNFQVAATATASAYAEAFAPSTELSPTPRQS